tara:strand:+ start:385 stop:597 length:213 start_codon:yes stop_codon:yes gene_type:complete
MKSSKLTYYDLKKIEVESHVKESERDFLIVPFNKLQEELSDSFQDDYREELEGFKEYFAEHKGEEPCTTK